MTKAQQRKLIEAMNEAKAYLHSQPEFMEDEELKAAYVAVRAVEAAVMFSETASLAKLCADWCEAVVNDTTERN